MICQMSPELNQENSRLTDKVDFLWLQFNPGSSKRCRRMTKSGNAVCMFLFLVSFVVSYLSIYLKTNKYETIK